VSTADTETPAAPDPVNVDAFAAAIINILEDTNSEAERLRLTHKAMLNILVDVADEREHLGDTHRALINMLDDFASEKTRLENTQKATLNILEDFEAAAASLQVANHELTYVDELKSEFVAMASHELRTPLTSIAGFSSTMLRLWPTLPEPDKFEYVGIIDTQAQRLTRLVEDLLTLSRIENRGLRINPSTVIVAPAINQALGGLEAAHVEVNCPDDLLIRTDHDHLQQIIINYVSNALEYGVAPIRVDAWTEGDSVRIQVSDCGDGVPPLFVSHLFERFSQANTSRTTDEDGKGRGTGLGLSIVYALARAHGGDAWYEPNLPSGSCFNVRLPQANE